MRLEISSGRYFTRSHVQLIPILTGYTFVASLLLSSHNTAFFIQSTAEGDERSPVLPGRNDQERAQSEREACRLFPEGFTYEVST